jgi:signal transduction histidine kinase
MSAAGPPQGAQHRSAQREGTPVSAARPPEGAPVSGDVVAAVRRWRHSAALRLALAFAGICLLTIATVLSVFYIRTVVLLDQRTVRQINTTVQQLQARYAQGGRTALVEAIEASLRDGEDSDRELLLLLDAQGQRLAGSTLFADPPPSGNQIEEQVLLRAGHPAPGYVTTRTLDDGSRLVVGHDRSEQLQMVELVAEAIKAATFLAVLLVVGGTYLFRDLLEQRIAALRETAAQVAKGRLTERVQPPDRHDEFALLEHDINRMLDRIQGLMQGVRHVSDTIAHNLRTPLTRALAHLHTTQHSRADHASLRAANAAAIGELEQLNTMFHKLLQIAEAEAGAQRQQFTSHDVRAIAADVVELYDAVAEDQGCALRLHGADSAHVLGDRDLLASAIANLIDNALKVCRATPGACVDVTVALHDTHVDLQVRDNGPGVPPEALARLGERFYRLDAARPGTGLGLASVRAIAQLHGAQLVFAHASPGLIARLSLPRA